MGLQDNMVWPIVSRATSDADGIALESADACWSWSALAATVSDAAHSLRALDLGDERRAAVFAHNSPYVLILHAAAMMAGVSLVPVHSHLTAAEAAYILRDSGARALFVGPDSATRGREAARDTSIRIVIGWGAGSMGVWDWDDWLENRSSCQLDKDGELVPRRPLCYTSGTTGRPKGVEVYQMLGGRSTRDYVASFLAQTALFAKCIGPHLVVAPLHHVAPLSVALSNLLHGRRVIVRQKFEAAQTLRDIEVNRVGSTVMVPTHFVRLLRLPRQLRAGRDVSSLGFVYHTGAACPVHIKAAMIDWWGRILYEEYGGTEAGAIASISSSEWLEHRGSVGRCVPRYRPVVVDDRGRELAVGEVGVLYFEDRAGRGVRYRNDALKTEEAHLRPSVFTLGDVGFIDSEGYLYVTDRTSDMVISGGVNIYPAEAEHTLLQHPDVLDVAVVGCPDEELGEVAVAIVVPTCPDAAPDPSDLLRYCRDKISLYKVPRRVRLAESLGRSSTGKLDKRALIERIDPCAP